MKKLIVGFFILSLATSWTISQEPTQKAEKKVFKSEENNRLFVNKDLGIYLWLSTSPDPEAEKIRLASDTSKKYSNPMYFDTEGYNTVRSPWIVDTTTRKAIYPQHDIIFEVYADGLPPVSKSIYYSTTNKLIEGKKYYGSNLRIQINSTDAVSGIKSLQYSLNGKPYTSYKEELSGFIEGENILKYYSTDNVGNQESIKEEIFYLDNMPPTTEFQMDGLKNQKYVSSNTMIKLTSTDNLSGVKAIYYSINNGSLQKYARPIRVSVLGTGGGTISFYAEDNIGNKEKEQIIGGKESIASVQGAGESQSLKNVIFEFYIDNEPPVVELQIENDLYKGQYNYVSGRSKFKVNAKDEKAGVKEIVYSINSKVIDVIYNEPFSLEKEGLKYVRVKASDYVGNVSPVIVKPYFCDISPPKSKILIGSPKFSSRDTVFISDKTRISFLVQDNQSGVQSTSYSINNGAYSEYIDPFPIDNKSGLQKITFFSKDNLNNKEEVISQELLLDNLPPVIHHHFSVESIGNKTVRDEVYTIYPTNVMLYIAATDASSGGERIEYTINEGSLLKANPVKGLGSGNYLIEVNAYDVLGNKSIKKIKFAIEE